MPLSLDNQLPDLSKLRPDWHLLCTLCSGTGALCASVYLCIAFRAYFLQHLTDVDSVSCPKLRKGE